MDMTLANEYRNDIITDADWSVTYTLRTISFLQRELDLGNFTDAQRTQKLEKIAELQKFHDMAAAILAAVTAIPES